MEEFGKILVNFAFVSNVGRFKVMVHALSMLKLCTCYHETAN